MKITVATPLYPPEIGGPATYSALLEKKLPLKGVEVLTVKFSDFRHLSKIFGRLKYTWALFKSARQSDVVYALDPVSVGLPAMLASILAGRPLVVKVVGDYAWEQGRQRFGVKADLDKFINHWFCYGFRVYFFKLIQTIVVWSARSVVVPSAYLGQVVAKWGIKPIRLKVIYNAFNAQIEVKSKEGLRAKFGHEGFVVVTACRLVPWKGVDGLIEAVVTLKNILPDIFLVVAGDGPERDRLERLVADAGAGSYIRFTGQLERAKLFEYIRLADLFVLNSEYEGLSHQLLEVMALETPIVATDIGGNPEVITTGETGILISPRANNELQAAIMWLAKSSVERNKLALAAKVSLSRFDEKIMVSNLVNHLNSLL